MRILYTPACAEYGAPGHPEAPERVLRTAQHLRAAHPAWFERPAADNNGLAADSALLRAHSAAHLARLHAPTGDFDGDTPALPKIETHARQAAGQ